MYNSSREPQELELYYEPLDIIMTNTFSSTSIAMADRDWAHDQNNQPLLGSQPIFAFQSFLDN